MTAALDLGSTEFRSLRREDHRLVARRLPAVYTVLEDQPAHRRLLDHGQMSYSVAGESLVVIGESARDVSSLLSRPLVPLFTNGKLPDQDPIARQVCAWLVELLIPPARQAAETCCLALPASETNGISGNETARFLEHVVQLHGYETSVMHPATALALAELECNGFTGATLVFGAESIAFAVTYQSQPVISLRLAKGSRDLWERFAHFRKRYLWDAGGNVYLDLPAVQNWLNREELSLSKPRHDDDAWFADAFEESLLSAWFSFKRKVSLSEHPVLKMPMPLVVAGGASRLAGFQDLVRESLTLSGIPLHVNEIRQATFEPYSVARGLLIHATLSAGEPVETQLALEAA